MPKLRARLLQDAGAGTLSALVTLSYAMSYSALVFSGSELSPFLSAGVHSYLMASWALLLVTAIGSSFPFAIAGPDSNASALLALTASSLATGLVSERLSGPSLVATVLMALSGAAIGVGLLTFVLGALRHGQIVRFVPYPLAAGFLAGTGFLILAGGFRVLTGEPLTWRAITATGSTPAIGWLTALGVAVALFVAPRFVRREFAMPLVIVVAIACFYAAGGQERLIFGAIDSSSPYFLRAESLNLVNWPALGAQWPHLAAMSLVVVVTLLLNATGLDLATQHDVNFDRELRATGIANVFSGLLGGTVGYLSVSRSLLNVRAGAASRAAGLFAAGLAATVAFFFPSALSYFPRPVLAGLLLFSGLSLLEEFLWGSFFRLPKLEWAVIVAIFLLILAEGLAVGVGFGLVVTSVFFVYSYSRTGSIKHSFQVGAHFSNKDRPLAQIAFLREKGKDARILSLQGYLFSGTASPIVEACRALLGSESLRYLLLDFRMVQGLDASAVWSFTKLDQLCASRETQLLFSGLKPELLQVLNQTKFLPRPSVLIFDDLDRAIEWIEERLLSEAGESFPDRDLLGRTLGSHFPTDAVLVLAGYCESVRMQEGEALFRKGDPGDALYFVERGEVSVSIPLGDGRTKRLRKCGAGTIVGEMALYAHQPRTADVVTDTACNVLRFSAENLRLLEKEAPDVAILFHTFVVKLLSSRLVSANDEIRALL